MMQITIVTWKVTFKLQLNWVGGGIWHRESGQVTHVRAPVPVCCTPFLILEPADTQGKAEENGPLKVSG